MMYSKKRDETDAHLYRRAQANKLVRVYEKIIKQDFERWLSEQPIPINPDPEDLEAVRKKWPHA